MGATNFGTLASGTTADDAFRNARADARHMNGHGGYTGSIAEKDCFVMVTVPAHMNADDYADQLLDTDKRIGDKYGPAGCIKMAPGKYYFFGMAAE